MKAWINQKLLNWAARIIHANGFVVADIRNVAGTNYIVDGKGNHHRIGGKK